MSCVTSAYIHIPFCASKCLYCDFTSFAGKEADIDKYVDALIAEMQMFVSFRATDSSDVLQPLRTLYIGGGTPSLLSGRQIFRIVDAARQLFCFDSDPEISVEINPNTVDNNFLRSFIAAGGNRVSLGVQSLNDALLVCMGRAHSASEAIDAIDLIQKAGITNISCDLIIGLPNQKIEQVISDTDTLIRKGIKHISIYSLSIEEGTVFEQKYADSIERLMPQAYEREMYHAVRRHLLSEGYEHYEISNFALPGYESRHNSMYWSASEYYGFGLAAHSYFHSERISHVEDLNTYIARAYDDLDAIVSERVVIDEEEKMKEFFLLGLRMIEGVSVNDYKDRFGDLPIHLHRLLEKHVSEGLLEHQSDRYYLTETGLDFANLVFRDFV